MKNILRAPFTLGVTLLGSLVLAGPTLTGVWKGKFIYDYSKLPATLTASQRKSVIESTKKRAESTITLTLKANHTFTMIASGVGQKAEPVSGNWGQDDKALTLQPVKRGMKDAMISFTFQNKGKSMSFTNGPLTMTFTR